MLRVALYVALMSSVCRIGQQQESDKQSIFADVQLVCVMDKSCDKKESCELPCKVQGAEGQADQVIRTTSFIDEEFEQLWDEMQEKMKGLDEHQTELLAQQHDLLKEQQRLEFENRRLKAQQSELLDRQEILEKENERLRAIEPGSDNSKETNKRIRDLEIQIKVLTEQQQKLSSQQNRLVEQQNRLMQRQRKLEQQNVNLQKRQERIESLKLGDKRPGSEHRDEEPTPPVDEPKALDPVIESKLESIKKEMEHRISQLTGQQEELLREQTRLIGRQIRLEEENQELRAKQQELHKKQKELEKENRELKANITHRFTDPEERRERIEASGLCEITHGGICFGLLGDGTDELTFNDAKKNCKKYGGDLANIYDEEHYKIIQRYFLKNNISSGVWLGMRYNPQNFRVTMTDGKEAEFIKWNFVYPLSYASYTAMYLFVDDDPKSLYSGMVNLPPSWKYPYALCQFGL